MADDPAVFGHELRLAGPDRLPDVAERFVTERFGARHVEIMLADYRIAGLWPLVRVEHALAGLLRRDSTVVDRVFASQATMIDDVEGGVRVFAPITAWSDRLGVLIVDLAERPSQSTIDALSAVADEFGVVLAAADKGTDRYRRARRRQRLTMAAEMQWDLLPGRALGGRNFLLAGQLEPAYAVCGDHFDWALNDSLLTITTVNGDGNGLDATMLTLLAVNAMRNARRSGGNLVEQAELASDVLFSQHGGKHHVSTLLIEVDLDTGEVNAIDAGSPMALRQRGNDISQIEFDKQMPLGMFAETRYDVQRFRLEPNDRLVMVSDGVHEATPEGRDAYGRRSLASAVRAARLQPATEAVASVMRSLRDYHGAAEFSDDAVIVCLDWSGGGPQARPPRGVPPARGRGREVDDVVGDVPDDPALDVDLGGTSAGRGERR